MPAFVASPPPDVRETIAPAAGAAVAGVPDTVVPAALGPLGTIAGPGVTDVFVNGDGSVWRDRGDGPERMPVVLDAGAARRLGVRLVAFGGRHVDDATPCADVRIGDGIRVHVVLPPVAREGPLISIRFPAPSPPGLDALAASGFLSEPQLDAVRGLVHRRANLLVTGAAGSGKTTFLAALLGEAPASERIVVLEDTAELRIRHPHVVSLEARQANLEGAGAVPLERLVREALRMRPDRIVVGECRGAELRELLAALNTGHDGGAGTLHANSLADVPARLEALGALAGLGPAAVARQASSAIHAVLHLERTGGLRRLAAIGRLEVGPGGGLEARAVGAGARAP